MNISQAARACRVFLYAYVLHIFIHNIVLSKLKRITLYRKYTETLVDWFRENVFKYTSF